MIDETTNTLNLINRFKALRKEKGWSKESAHTIAICAESKQAVSLFGNKYNSYAYIIDNMAKYDDAETFIRDLLNTLVPLE